jgi:hypothetical protein
MPWPDTIRIEVKSTTGEAVPLPARELEALSTRSDEEVGIVAVLFWCGNRSVDGRWLIADAEDSFRKNASQTITVSRQNMQRAHRGQTWLAELKAHVDAVWPAFLQGFHGDAMSGHEALCRVLADCHEHGTIGERLPSHRVLETDHRDSVDQIIRHFGESNAGHIFQDLFAYLVGYAGYSEVLLNAVGVPDITISGFRRSIAVEQDIDLGKLPESDVQRLLSHCKSAGDEDLVNLLLERLRDSNSSVVPDEAEDI